MSQKPDPCKDCPPEVTPEHFLPKTISDLPPCNVERLMHRVAGLEALLISISHRLDKARQESQARDGYSQTLLLAVDANARATLQVASQPLTITAEKAFGHVHPVTVKRDPVE